MSSVLQKCSGGGGGGGGVQAGSCASDPKEHTHDEDVTIIHSGKGVNEDVTIINGGNDIVTIIHWGVTHMMATTSRGEPHSKWKWSAPSHTCSMRHMSHARVA